MRNRIYLLRLAVFISLLALSTVLCLAQDSLDLHFTPTNLSFKKEKLRLDIAAKMIESNLDKDIVLIGYSRKGRKFTALQRLQKSKQYLMQKHKISPNRIHTAYAGESVDALQISIFIDDHNSLMPKEKE